MQPDFKRFSANRLFEGLNLHQLTSIFERVQARTYTAGQVILDSSSTEFGFYLVIEGPVRISAIVNDVDMVLTILYPGDFFGEGSVVEGGAPSAQVTAQEPAILYFLPRADFLELTAGSSALAARLWESLARNLITRMKKTNATVQEYFAVNRALCENPKFRELYRLCHFGG